MKRFRNFVALISNLYEKSTQLRWLEDESQKATVKREQNETLFQLCRAEADSTDRSRKTKERQKQDDRKKKARRQIEQNKK